MSRWDEEDAAEETETSEREVRRAWHDARDHAAGSGQLNERNTRKTSDSREGGILSGIFRKIGLGK